MKKLPVGIIVGLITGIILVILKYSLNLTDKQVYGLFIIFVILVLAAAAINIIYYVYYAKKIQSIVPLLDEKPDEFTAEIEALLKKAKGKNIRSTLMLNLAAGYMEKKEYNKALEIFEGFDVSALKNKALAVVYNINFCLCLFQTSDTARAKAMYLSSSELFDKYRQSRQYGGFIALLEALSLKADGSSDKAIDVLKNALENCENKSLKKAIEEEISSLSENSPEN